MQPELKFIRLQCLTKEGRTKLSAPAFLFQATWHIICHIIENF